jgi:hypothetical protein
VNVVMIGPFAFRPKGTVSVRAFFIARALVQRGHRATILMPPYDNLADSGKIGAQDGVRLENMAMRRNDAWHQLVNLTANYRRYKSKASLWETILGLQMSMNAQSRR